MSTPQTTIYICQTLGLSSDYRHTFWFDNAGEQASFFKSKVLKTFVNYTFIRKNWSVKVNASIADAEKWGYLFFNNYPTGKYYYYFITNVKYISDETVELELEMDVMQTYMFDYALQPCFVEREHSSTDNVGDNTVEEDLELGKLVNGNKNSPDMFKNELAVMVMTSEYPYTTQSGNKFGGAIYDGIYSGCPIYCVTEMDTLIGILNQVSDKDIIVSIWLMPKELVITKDDNNFPLVSSSKVEGVDYYPPIRPSTINGYTPKNNKLFTYPYCFLYGTNYNGGSVVYRYERFAENNPRLVIEGSVFPDGGIKVTPYNYNGSGYNYDESFNLGAPTTCPWVSDTYKIWLAQNQNSQNMQGLMNAGSAVVGLGMLIGGAITSNPLLMAGGGGTLVSGISGIGSQLAQRTDMQAQPDQARGNASKTLNASLRLYVDFYQKTITAERAEIIDNYFTMFGYKTLRVKTPNRNVRKSFTYTKTQGCLITGSLCIEDARKIQSIYDNGVTFWQKDVSIGNYSASNAVK